MKISWRALWKTALTVVVIVAASVVFVLGAASLCARFPGIGFYLVLGALVALLSVFLYGEFKDESP